MLKIFKDKKRCADKILRKKIFFHYNCINCNKTTVNKENNTNSDRGLPPQWNKGKCYVCKKNILFTDLWHCAHIIAHSKGGKTNLSNLVPTCIPCNKHMGNTNLFDYMKL